MEILLDTQILIWLAEAPDKISPSALAVLNSDNWLFVSYVSVWEMAIKIKSGKLTLSFAIEEFIDKAKQKHTLEFLSIKLVHIYKTLELPLHHNDPFDRLLIAQALTENMPVVSSDSKFDNYPVNRIW